jgi:ribosomal protein S18 acetylase RimI-like enzyme
MEIRLIRPDECDALAAITVAAYRQLHSGEPLGPYEGELRDVDARRRDSEVYVALEGTILLGGVTFVPSRDRRMAEFTDPEGCGIRMLAVDPTFQGRGAGRALVEKCLVRAHELGRTRIILHSAPTMTLAQAMYVRMGFSRAPELDEFIHEGPYSDTEPLHLRAYTRPA